jgi:hypothetical protein
MPDLTLSVAELVKLTGYRRPSDQLRELHLQGFLRARRNRLGGIVLERGHYDAVVAGGQALPAQDERPPIYSLRRAA